MQPAKPGEFGVGKAGYGAEDAKLLAVFQFGLKSDHVEQPAEFIVLTELHDGVGFYSRMVRVGEAKRLHRPMAQRFRSAFGHNFDRQKPSKYGVVVSKSWNVTLSPATSASTKASYCSLVNGQLM